MIEIVRRDDQAAKLRADGGEHVLVSSAPEFERDLRARCEQLGARYAFDAVGGAMTGQLVRGLAVGSTVIVYGMLAGEPVQIDNHELVFRRAIVRGFTMYDWLEATSVFGKLRALGAAQRRIHDALRTEIRARVPFREPGRALELARNGASDGKVLLVLGPEHA
jgi:NADPH:quinone reductase-like Zn-dependent oxidoreductase